MGRVRWLVVGVALLLVAQGLLLWRTMASHERRNVVQQVQAIDRARVVARRVPPEELTSVSASRSGLPSQSGSASPFPSPSPSNRLPPSSSDLFQPGFSFTGVTHELLSPERAWKPHPNGPPHHLCVIVPFRESPTVDDEVNNGVNRSAHLAEFIPYMRRWLRKYGVSFTFIIAEQEQGLLFNRGAVFNFGFLASRHLCDYAVFHDVDYLPVHKDNRYAFPAGPIHLSVANHYDEGPQVGGVYMSPCDVHIDLGGWSNRYWGWGFEDFDMSSRVTLSEHKLLYLDRWVGVYKEMQHKRGNEIRDSPQLYDNIERWKAMRHGGTDYRNEGLRSVEGSILEVLVDRYNHKHYVFRIDNREGILPDK
jgi:hypothetical protein